MLILSSKAPENHMRYLITQTSYLVNKELDMFLTTSRKFNINIQLEPNFITDSYTSYLKSLAYSESYFLGLVALYCEEKAYYEAWRWVKNNTDLNRNKYSDLISHWSSEDFRKYVEKLEEMVNETSLSVSEEEKNKVNNVYKRVSEFEKLFWENVIK